MRRRCLRGSGGTSVGASEGIAESEEDAADEGEADKYAENGACAEGDFGVGLLEIFGFFVTVHSDFFGGSGTVGFILGANFPSSEMNSTGSGKTTVVFFSVPMSVRV